MLPYFQSTGNQSQSDFQQISVFNAKKLNEYTEKQIGTVINRLSLLKKAQEKEQRKISEMSKKNDELIRQKQIQEQQQFKKKYERDKSERQLAQLQQVNLQMKHEQQYELKNIRIGIEQMKKMDHDEIRQKSEQNLKGLQNQRLKTMSVNQLKKLDVQQQKLNSKYSIQNFWDDKMKQRNVNNNNLKCIQLNSIERMRRLKSELIEEQNRQKKIVEEFQQQEFYISQQYQSLKEGKLNYPMKFKTDQSSIDQEK